MDYSKPSMIRADLMVEHCMCCLVVSGDQCQVDSPIFNPLGPARID